MNYPATGVCNDGECTYTPTETPCASTETCAQGACLVVDPCEGVTCASPPADFCNGNSAVTYSSAGTCNEGDCNYASTTEACGDFAFCESGACVPTTETKIVINEIYYNPPTTQGDDLDYEFLELYNAGQTVNLENWVFTSGITHTFEAITFESGTFLLLVNRPENYDHLPVTVVEWESGNLKNDIETLTLKDPTGAVMDGMTYDVRAASGCLRRQTAAESPSNWGIHPWTIRFPQTGTRAKPFTDPQGRQTALRPSHRLLVAGRRSIAVSGRF